MASSVCNSSHFNGLKDKKKTKDHRKVKIRAAEIGFPKKKVEQNHCCWSQLRWFWHLVKIGEHLDGRRSQSRPRSRRYLYTDLGSLEFPAETDFR